MGVRLGRLVAPAVCVVPALPSPVAQDRAAVPARIRAKNARGSGARLGVPGRALGRVVPPGVVPPLVDVTTLVPAHAVGATTVRTATGPIGTRIATSPVRRRQVRVPGAGSLAAVRHASNRSKVRVGVAGRPLRPGIGDILGPRKVRRRAVETRTNGCSKRSVVRPPARCVGAPSRRLPSGVRTLRASPPTHDRRSRRRRMIEVLRPCVVRSRPTHPGRVRRLATPRGTRRGSHLPEMNWSGLSAPFAPSGSRSD